MDCDLSLDSSKSVGGGIFCFVLFFLNQKFNHLHLQMLIFKFQNLKKHYKAKKKKKKIKMLFARFLRALPHIIVC